MSKEKEVALVELPPVEQLLPRCIPQQPPVPHGMRKFTIFRRGDESGVSGTGLVIQGVMFANGACVIQWLCGPDPGDIQIKNFQKFLDTHIRSHPHNHSVLTWENGEQEHFAPKPHEDK